MVLQTRAMLAVEDDRCFECLAEARREASKEQRSIGELLVTELEQRLMRGRFNGVRRLFEEIQANYLDNPRVEQQLFRALMNLGLVTQDGRVRLPAETPEGCGLPMAAAAPIREPRQWPSPAAARSFGFPGLSRNAARCARCEE
jgi:hypothetical protein